MRSASSRRTVLEARRSHSSRAKPTRNVPHSTHAQQYTGGSALSVDLLAGVPHSGQDSSAIPITCFQPCRDGTRNETLRIGRASVAVPATEGAASSASSTVASAARMGSDTGRRTRVGADNSVSVGSSSVPQESLQQLQQLASQLSNVRECRKRWLLTSSASARNRSAEFSGTWTLVKRMMANRSPLSSEPPNPSTLRIW
jgi:hypothetical protein